MKRVYLCKKCLISVDYRYQAVYACEEDNLKRYCLTCAEDGKCIFQVISPEDGEYNEGICLECSGEIIERRVLWQKITRSDYV